jgi:hypothetical protein
VYRPCTEGASRQSNSRLKTSWIRLYVGFFFILPSQNGKLLEI